MLCLQSDNLLISSPVPVPPPAFNNPPKGATPNYAFLILDVEVDLQTRHTPVWGQLFGL